MHNDRVKQCLESFMKYYGDRVVHFQTGLTRDFLALAFIQGYRFGAGEIGPETHVKTSPAGEARIKPHDSEGELP